MALACAPPARALQTSLYPESAQILFFFLFRPPRPPRPPTPPQILVTLLAPVAFVLGAAMEAYTLMQAYGLDGLIEKASAGEPFPLAVVVVTALIVVYGLSKVLAFAAQKSPPRVVVATTDFEAKNKLEGLPKFDINKLSQKPDKVFLWDPCTMDYLGEKPIMGEQVSVDTAGSHTHRRWPRPLYLN